MILIGKFCISPRARIFYVIKFKLVQFNHIRCQSHLRDFVACCMASTLSPVAWRVLVRRARHLDPLMRHRHGHRQCHRTKSWSCPHLLWHAPIHPTIREMYPQNACNPPAPALRWKRVVDPITAQRRPGPAQTVLSTSRRVERHRVEQDFFASPLGSGGGAVFTPWKEV